MQTTAESPGGGAGEVALVHAHLEAVRPGTGAAVASTAPSREGTAAAMIQGAMRAQPARPVAVVVAHREAEGARAVEEHELPTGAVAEGRDGEARAATPRVYRDAVGIHGAQVAATGPAPEIEAVEANHADASGERGCEKQRRTERNEPGDEHRAHANTYSGATTRVSVPV